jgi:hypothetical protein
MYVGADNSLHLWEQFVRWITYVFSGYLFVDVWDHVHRAEIHYVIGRQTWQIYLYYL